MACYLLMGIMKVSDLEEHLDDNLVLVKDVLMAILMDRGSVCMRVHHLVLELVVYLVLNLVCRMEPLLVLKKV